MNFVTCVGKCSMRDLRRVAKKCEAKIHFTEMIKAAGALLPEAASDLETSMTGQP